MITPIGDALKKYVSKNSARFHMPGHKGRNSFLSSDFFKFDMTEIGELDNLYMPEGIIKESQDAFCKFLHAGEMHYIVNGSTAGVIASLLSLGENKKVIFARDFHLSCVSAMISANITPVFVYHHDTASFRSSVSTQDILWAIAENKDADCVYITYPNYYGRCVDLKKICDAAHVFNIPVIVDGAHSAMFSFSDLLPADCGECGADVWTMSLHKTLCAPNQSAVVCVSENSLISSSKIKKCINMVQTTSPSYPMLAAMEYALAEMAEKGDRLIYNTIETAKQVCSVINSITGLSCVKSDDKTKIYIDVTDRGLTGFKAASILEKYGVFVETADQSGLLLMCTHKNTKEDFYKLIDALKMLKGTDFNLLSNAFSEGYTSGEIFELLPRKAALSESRYVDITYALDKISAGSVGAYPPGVPIILPGMRITANVLHKLNKMKECGHSLYGILDGKIEIVK